MRDLEATDLDWLARLHADPEVMRYVRAPDDYARTRVRIGELLAEAAANPGLGVLPAERLEDGAVIGWFVLTHLDGGEEVELGYRLFPEFWGQGFATEGARGLVEHAFGALGLIRLVAVARPENAASCKVLLKAGFRDVGRRHVYGASLAAFECERA